MKKTILYSLLFAGMMTGCDLDINDNPNYPANEQMTPDLIFPSVGAGIAAAVGGDIHNYAGFFSQYFEQSPESSQYTTISQYNLSESSQLIDYSYSNIYSSALMDAKEVLDKSTNTAMSFATTVLRAYVLQVMVDNTSEAPYTEALKGTEVSNPKWDAGEDVYKGVLKEMDDAEAALNAEPSSLDAEDMIFDGDLSQWKGFANALRLRMYMRFIDAGVEVDTYTEKVKTLVTANNFFIGDAGFSGFSDESSKRNPWYETNAILVTGGQCAAYPIVSYYESTNDPRISFAINQNKKDNKYVGQIPGGREKSDEYNGSDKWMNQDVSAINHAHADGKGAVQPVYFFTQANLQFLIAEVRLRFMNDEAGAKTAYDNAVKSDFEARSMGGQETEILNLWNSASTQDDKLNLIYMQKWAALFCMDHMEAWSELRRTDVPKLTTISQDQIFKNGTGSGYTAGDLISPWKNAMGSGLVKRVNYPLSARMYNVNTPKAVSLDTPVWWDK